MNSYTYERAMRLQTIDRLQRDRNSYLTAVAMHHARVAQIACDMAEMCRPETWNTEIMEAMAAKIEESHIVAFGSPTVEPPLEDKCECHERDSSFVCDYCYARGERGHMQR